MRVKSRLLVALVVTIIVGAQARQKADTAGQAISQTTSPTDIARIAVASLGGDKFRKLKSLSLFGSAELYYSSRRSNSTVGKFAIVQTGERARTDIETPDLSFQEIHDGKRAYSTVNANSVPPPSRYGLPVLARFDQPGYTVTVLPDKKDQRGFRITDAEGNATDYYVDRATGRLAGYSFEYNSIKIVTEYSSFKEVEGVLVPVTFLRQYVLPRVSIFMEFKVKEAKINQPIADDVFIIPER